MNQLTLNAAYISWDIKLSILLILIYEDENKFLNLPLFKSIRFFEKKKINLFFFKF